MLETNSRLPILIVEDSDEDFDVLAMTFENFGVTNKRLRAGEGSEVFRVLEELSSSGQPLPGLIVLDLNLIGVDGREVLRRLKRDPAYQRIPVAVFSTSSSPRDVETCYAEGAASYSVKPVSLERLEEFVLALKNFWLCNTILPRPSALDRMKKSEV